MPDSIEKGALLDRWAGGCDEPKIYTQCHTIINAFSCVMFIFSNSFFSMPALPPYLFLDAVQALTIHGA